MSREEAELLLLDIKNHLREIRELPGKVTRGWMDTLSFDQLVKHTMKQTNNKKDFLLTTLTLYDCKFERDPMLEVEERTHTIVLDRVVVVGETTVNCEHILVSTTIDGNEDPSDGKDKDELD